MDEIINQNTENEDQPTAETNPADLTVIQEMAKAGILFGRKRSVTNPKMRKFIFGTRNGFEIINLEKTLSQLETAKDFLKEVASTGQLILFVGTRPETRDVVKEAAQKGSYPHVTNRWLGGTLTNFDTINQRLTYYIGLKEDREAGRLDKYTKKERVNIEKNLERLDRLFGGLEKLDKMPAALIVVNADAHETAIREARQKNIPVVALANTSADPAMLSHLIPTNDTSRSSAKFILDQLMLAIEEGRTRKTTSSDAPPPAPQADSVLE